MAQTLEAAMFAATEAVVAFASGECSFDEFRARYGSFFYEAALDGHEGGTGNRAFLQDYAELVSLHANMQNVLDRVYAPPDGVWPSPSPPGRIPAADARAEIRRAVDRIDVPKQMRRLSAGPRQ